MKSSASVVSFCCWLAIVLNDNLLLMSRSQPLVPALYVFGDSLLDSGNNNFLPTLAKANYLPYGISFAKGVTGRFTNGRTVADFIAEFLGLPDTPPYLALRGPNTRTGLNYASGSCGILSDTGSPYGKCFNLDEQIGLFERTVESELTRLLGSPSATTDHLSKSIFIFAIGSNDYITNYLDPNKFDTSTSIAPQPYAEYLVNKLFHSLQRMYSIGARKIVVFEIGPIGCIPSIIAKYKDKNPPQEEDGNKGPCVEEANQVVSFFNAQLKTMLQNLTSALQGSTFVLGQANWLGYDAITNPSAYGLTNTMNPCCRTWANGTSSCIPLSAPCSEPDKFFFWDAFHMTEVPSSLIASRCFNDSSVCSPYTIRELALK